MYVYRGFVLPLVHKQSARKRLFTLADIRIYRVRVSRVRDTQHRVCRYLDRSVSPAIFELRHTFLLPSLPLRSRCLRTRFAAQMRLSCRRNPKQVFSQSSSAGDAQKRSYFSPVRCRQEVLLPYGSVVIATRRLPRDAASCTTSWLLMVRIDSICGS